MFQDVLPPTAKMGHLIPLFLESVPRPRDSNPLPDWDPIPRAESPTLPLPSNVENAKVHGKPRPLTKLTIVPYTAAEWLKVMEEVKALYYKKQYKQCSIRCKQILETVRDPDRVHLLYSIYLCFFTASSLELQARSLHCNSSLRLSLFNESLTYYEKAQSHMEFAAFATNPAIIHASSTNKHQNNSSISSSIRSSVDSIFSELSTSSIASSVLDSPTSNSSPWSGLTRKDSISDSSSPMLRPAPLRTKKKRVTFSLTAEPGLEDSQDGGMTAGDLLSCFPSPPTQDTISPTTIPQNFNPPRSPSSPSSPSVRNSIITTTRSTSITSHCNLATSLAAHSAFRKAESLTRYRKHLDSLNDQLEYHITSLQAQIHTLTTIRRARRSNSSDLFDISPPYNSSTWSGSQSTNPSSSPGHSPSNSINSTLDLTIPQQLSTQSQTLHTPPSSIKFRIQRLKERNWKRPRFSPLKYQILCEVAIQEIHDNGRRSIMG